MRMDEEEWDAVIATNLAGPFWMTRAVARPMMKARSGRIINMSSAAGRMGNPGQANYAAAKAGLIGLTKTTARELASRGITCNAIAPGLIETDLTANLPPGRHRALTTLTPLGYVGSVDDVAAAAVYFASDEARYVTGQVLGVDGGIVMGTEATARSRLGTACQNAGTASDTREEIPCSPCAPCCARRGTFTPTATSRAASTTPSRPGSRPSRACASSRSTTPATTSSSAPAASMSRRSAPSSSKHHLDVLWHDYFKPEHLEKHPGIHDVFWKAAKQASKVKQSMDVAAARSCCVIDSVDEMWKATGGPEKTRVSGRPA